MKNRDGVNHVIQHISRSTLGEAVGAVLRDARRKQRLSLDRWAAAAGVDRSTAEKCEKGRPPSLFTFVRLACGLSLPPGEVLTRAIPPVKGDH